MARGRRPPEQRGGENATGLRRLAVGAGLGLAGGLAALILPIAFVELSVRAPGGFFRLGPELFRATSVLVLAGSLLFVLSLLLYRRAFAHLRRVDPRFTLASALCLLGTLGFLLLVVAAALLFARSDALLGCLDGRPTQVYACFRSVDVLGAWTGIVGFVLGWLGGLGIVLGVAQAGGRYREGSIRLGAALYALLLLVLVGPFALALVVVPGVEILLLAVPVLALVAPAIVFAGARAAVARLP